RLAVAHPDAPRSVADHDERGEREPAAALHHLGHAVDGDDAFLQASRALLSRGIEPPHQIVMPPSRAPSASAATRPWYSRPPRSNTARSIPACLARSASSLPAALARAVLSPSASASASEAAASVRAEASSTSCA